MKEFEIDSIGKLIPHPDVPDEWLISKSIPIPLFDGKELKFTFQEDLDNGENFLSEANQIIESFLRKDISERTTFSHLIYQNYRQIQDYYDSQSWGAPPLELKNENEIWNYVYPQEICICKGYNEDKNLYILVACECKWEEEHGLQLVFRNGAELTRVSSIDYNPTE